MTASTLIIFMKVANEYRKTTRLHKKTHEWENKEKGLNLVPFLHFLMLHIHLNKKLLPINH